MRTTCTDISRYDRLLPSIEITQRLLRFAVLVCAFYLLGALLLSGLRFLGFFTSGTLSGNLLSRIVLPSATNVWALPGTPDMSTVHAWFILSVYFGITLIFYFFSHRIQSFGKVTAFMLLACVVLGVPLFFTGLTRSWVISTVIGWPMVADLVIVVSLALWINIVLFLGCLNILRISHDHRALLRPVRTDQIAVQFLGTTFDVPANLRYMKSGRLLAYLTFLASAALYSVSAVYSMQAFSMFARRYDAALTSCTTVACVQAKAMGALVSTFATVLFVLPMCVFLSNKLLGLARRRVRLDLAELQRADARDPILFLRPFRDDQVALRQGRPSVLERVLSLGKPHEFLDHVLLEEATLYGPMVAFGNPEDQMPPFGITRGYFAGATWREAIARVSTSARAIVLCLDDTPGIRWEMSHVIRAGQLAKCLFVIHPRLRPGEQYCSLLLDLLDELIATKSMDADAARELDLTFRGPAAVGFYVREGRLMIFTSVEGRQPSYLFVVRSFLRETCGSRLQSRLVGMRERDSKAGSLV